MKLASFQVELANFVLKWQAYFFLCVVKLACPEHLEISKQTADCYEGCFITQLICPNKKPIHFFRDLLTWTVVNKQLKLQGHPAVTQLLNLWEKMVI